MPNFESMNDAFISHADILEIVNGIEGLKEDLDKAYQTEEDIESQLCIVRSDLRHLDAILSTFDSYDFI